MPKAVTGSKAEGFTFTCPYPVCGANGESFTSSEWANRDDAVARGQQHLDEHERKIPMQELADFRAERGLTAKTATFDPSKIEL